MKNRILLIFLALVLTVSMVAFAACKAEEAPPVVEEEEPPVVEEEEPPVVEEVWEWPKRLKVLCGTGVGVASTTAYISEVAKDTGMQIRVVPEGNLALSARWLHTQGFFSWSQAPSAVGDILEVIKGNAWRDGGPFPIRVLWAHSKSTSIWMVRGDSEIKTIYDIKPGHSIVYFSFIPGAKEGYPYALLDWVGLTPEDVEWWPGASYGASIRAISQGQADLVWCFPTSPDVYEAAAGPYGVRVLELPADKDPEGAAIYLSYKPSTQFFPTPEGGGIDEAVGVMTSGSVSAIHTTADWDTELVYNYVKWMDENYDLYKENHAWCKYMTLDTTMEIVETYYVPAHDGLVKYLQEKGLWTPAHEARQQQNIEFLDRYIEAYQTAIEMADDKGIDIQPASDEWIEFWVNYKKQIGLDRFVMFIGLDEQ